jgi:hypothetical protein
MDGIFSTKKYPINKWTLTEVLDRRFKVASCKILFPVSHRPIKVTRTAVGGDTQIVSRLNSP